MEEYTYNQKTLITVMLATLSVVGIIGNTLTIYVFNSQKQKVGELPKSCPNHAQIMPKSSPNYTQIMPKYISVTKNG